MHFDTDHLETSTVLKKSVRFDHIQLVQHFDPHLITFINVISFESSPCPSIFTFNHYLKLYLPTPTISVFSNHFHLLQPLSSRLPIFISKYISLHLDHRLIYPLQYLPASPTSCSFSNHSYLLRLVHLLQLPLYFGPDFDFKIQIQPGLLSYLQLDPQFGLHLDFKLYPPSQPSSSFFNLLHLLHPIYFPRALSTSTSTPTHPSPA
jgi:hypothetical protein